MKKIFLTLTAGLLLAITCAADGQTGRFSFIDVESTELKFGELPFADVKMVRPVSDGFIALLYESRSLDSGFLVKLDKKGVLKKHYARRGNGPGEFRHVSGFFATPGAVYVGEAASPYIHQFSPDLEFITDHRVRKGGVIVDLGAYAGIWGPVTENNRIHTLTVYNLKDFKFIKYAFEIDHVPQFTQFWGGVCKDGNGGYAGVYPCEYRIRLFDGAMNPVKTLVSRTPDHIKPYRRSRVSPHAVDNGTDQWLGSWSKIQSVLYVNGYYLVKYMHDSARFTDIVDGGGEIVAAMIPETDEFRDYSDGQLTWKLKWKDLGSEQPVFFCIAEKLDTPKGKRR